MYYGPPQALGQPGFVTSSASQGNMHRASCTLMRLMPLGKPEGAIELLLITLYVQSCTYLTYSNAHNLIVYYVMYKNIGTCIHKISLQKIISTTNIALTKNAYKNVMSWLFKSKISMCGRLFIIGTHKRFEWIYCSLL